MTPSRLPLALSFAGHAAFLVLAVWLGTRAPPIPDHPGPHTIPLIFMEPGPSADQTPPSDQTAPVPPGAAASEPAEAIGQTPSSSVVEENPPSEQARPAPPVAAAAEPAVAPDPSTPVEPALAMEPPAKEPVPTAREKPTPPPAQTAVAQSRTPEPSETAAEPVSRTPHSTSTAPAPSRAKLPKQHNPAKSSVPAPAAKVARGPPAESHAGPAVARQDAPAPIASTLGAPASMQMAAVPPAAVAPPQSPLPQISAEYRIALSTWLERHKIYPEAARQRGEQGSAILRFRVGRDGRVLTYQLVRSTGHAALDAAVDEMMRGATLPPFPASMTQPEIAVSVPIRFSLSG